MLGTWWIQQGYTKCHEMEGNIAHPFYLYEDNVKKKMDELERKKGDIRCGTLYICSGFQKGHVTS